MIELVGWIGGIALAVCAIPQVVATWKTKSMDGISWLFLILWFIGEICTVSYIIITNMSASSFQIPLIVNCVLNIILLFYLLWAKYRY